MEAANSSILAELTRKVTALDIQLAKQRAKTNLYKVRGEYAARAAQETQNELLNTQAALRDENERLEDEVFGLYYALAASIQRVESMRQEQQDLSAKHTILEGYNKTLAWEKRQLESQHERFRKFFRDLQHARNIKVQCLERLLDECEKDL